MSYLREKAGDEPHDCDLFERVGHGRARAGSRSGYYRQAHSDRPAWYWSRLSWSCGLTRPYKTLKDFIDAAKANPGKLKQSGGSVLSRDAVVRYVLMNNTKAEWSFISFPSGGERIAAVLGGHVDMMMIEPSEAGELIRSGKLRAIAQIADQRIEGFPDVPTIKEAGFNIPNVPQSRGVVGPPDMSAAAVAYYDDLFKRASASPAYGST